MLGKSEIEKLIRNGEADPTRGISIVPTPLGHAPSQLGPGSLDLRLGRWFLVLQQSRRVSVDFRTKSDAEHGDIDGKYYYAPFGKQFIIHPGRFILGVTLEWITLPPTVGGYILGKSSVGRRGLVIETAAGVQPGFSGCLTLELSNCGEVPIAVEPGMRISQIFLHYVDGDTAKAASNHHGMRRPAFGTYGFDIKAPQAEGELPL